ncbi:MAG: hypothetical protein ABI413_04715 [Ktedonobacteraceae bacterium]
MIVSLVQETRQLTQEIVVRENAKSMVESVQETLSILAILRGKASQLQTHLQILRARLPTMDVQTALDNCKYGNIQLRDSASRFSIQPRQKNELQAVQKQIEKALSGLQKAWQSYASERTREPFELYILVGYLPEVAARQVVYDELKRKLTTASETVPSSWQQLQTFDQTIEQFTQMLGEIEGLNEAVKGFLLKTLSGTASLADVTDEVLQWCRQGQHARTFSIRFAR